jgi:hypothetical protein
MLSRIKTWKNKHGRRENIIMNINKNAKITGVRPRIGTDLLLMLIILAGFSFYTSLIPLAPNDYWWHLRVGHDIYSSQTIPKTNQYSWTVPVDQPFFYGAWLAEFLFYILNKAGGLSLNIFTRNLLVVISFGMIALEAKRRSGSWRISAIVLSLACGMSINNLLLRTQIWAFLPFMITFSLLSRYQDNKLHHYWLLACPVVMIFWVNVHGSFILGLALMGMSLIGSIIECYFTPQKTHLKYRIYWLAGITGLTTMAVLINPRFISIISYVVKLLTDPPSQNLIEEWQSPTPTGIANTIFYISILLIILTLNYSRNRAIFSKILMFLALLWLAWSGQRYVIWYGMVAMPFLAKLISDLPFRTPELHITKTMVNGIIAILLFLPAVLVQPWFVEKFPLPETYSKQVQCDAAIGPLISPHTPIAAARYLLANPGGRLFNELGYGSYLIWAAPDTLVFIDPRVELYSQEIWDDYVHISSGRNVNFLLGNYGIDRILLDKDLQPELSIYLEKDPSWRLEFSDQVSELWTTNSQDGIQ